jgi:hypothetical protein
MSEIPSPLITAYLAAHYSFISGSDRVPVRIGEACLAAARLISELQCPGAFYITAYNPRSKARTSDQNATASTELLAALEVMPVRVLGAIGEDPEGTVPPEPGFMVFGPAQKDAEALGKRFGQNAIVWIAPSGVPQLLLLR